MEAQPRLPMSDLPERDGRRTPAVYRARRRATWRLDEQTRQIGLRGVAQARVALANAGRRGRLDPDQDGTGADAA